MLLRCYYDTNTHKIGCWSLSGTVAKWLSMRTDNTGAVSSNPVRVTIKTPLVRKAMGNHLTKTIS